MSEVIDTSPSNVDSSCASSNPAFLMIYSAYRLNKQGDNIHSWCTPFTIWNQSVPSLFLTVSSWPSYRFIMRQVRWSGIPVSWRIFRSLCVWVEFQLYFVKLWKAVKAFWCYSSVLGRWVLYNSFYLLWKLSSRGSVCACLGSQSCLTLQPHRL